MSVLHSLSRSKVEYISSSYLKRILVILWTILVSYPICIYAGTLNPIIALPGLTGSIIEIEANNAVMPGLCPRTYTRKRMWLNIEELFLLRCWRESMKLTIDSDGFGAPPDGLQGYVSNDGIFATSCMDPSDFVSCSITKYMGKFFKYLISQGYTSGLNLDAIAYDWRYSHLEFRLPGNYFSRLQRRVESMYAANGNMKVTLVGHSMGAATTTLFLSLQEASWKDKYIRMFISVSGAFSGAPLTLLSTIIGDPLVVISASTVQEVVVTYPGIHSLLPANTKESEPFSPSDPVVTLGTENFTINDIPSLYEKVGLAEYAPIVNKLRGRYQVPPGVRTHCVFGSGFDTLSSITIPDPNQMDKFTSEYVDGDKTLTLRGQQVCAQFATRQVQSVTSLTFNHDHHSIISDAVDVWEHIFEITNDRPPGAFNSVIKMRPVSLLHAFLFFRIVFF